MPITEYLTSRDFYPHLPQNSSYWDRLPPELKDYIMRLARNQILLERRRNKKLRRLHKEIVAYAKLKEQWGIGHIKIVQCREGRCRYMKIYGCYIDAFDKPKETYLSDSYKETKRRVPIEKTFLYPTRYELLHTRKRSHSLTESLG